METLSLPLAAFPPFLTDLAFAVAATLPLAEDEATAAALAIADGHLDQGWQLLTPLIAHRPTDPTLWQMAFETLTLLGNAVELENLVATYAETFGELPAFALAAQEAVKQLKAVAQAQLWPTDLTAQAASELTAAWNPAINKSYVFDVSQVSTVSPQGAQIVIEALKELIKKGGELRWRGLNPLLTRYPGQNLLSSPAELQLAILWLSAAGNSPEAEALAMEHALRFDTSPPEWCLQAAGSAEDSSAAPASRPSASSADSELLLPEAIARHHTEALLRRLERKAEAGQALSVDASRLRQWPVVELLTLAFGLRHLPQPGSSAAAHLLRCYRAPQWLQRVIPPVGLAPWFEFVDNSGS